MTCRRIKKAKITNVDLVIDPANHPSTLVMAKGNDEPARGVIGKVMNMLAGLVSKHTEPEYEEVDAEAGVYDLTLGLCNTFEGILGGDQPINEKKAEVAKAVLEYKDIISKFLFDGEPIEGDGVEAARIERLSNLKDKLDTVIKANGRTELKQEIEKGVDGVNGVDVCAANDPSPARTAADGPLEDDSAAKANDLGSPASEAGGSEASDSQSASIVEQAADGNVGNSIAGGSGTGADTGLAGTGVAGNEGAGEQPAALGAPSVENDNSTAAVGEENRGQSDAELVLSAIEAKYQERLIAYQKRIEEQEIAIAKANLRRECAKFEAIGFPADEATEVFYALSKADPAKYQALKQRLDAILNADTIAKGLLSEIGRNNQSGDEISPVAKIEKIALSISAKENIGIEQARAKAWIENPQIYKEYHQMRYSGGK